MATWLDQVNAYRALANVPAVTEYPALSAAARNLAEYEVKNLPWISHLSDQPNNPFYQTAQDSNLWGSSDPNAPESQAIKDWTADLFHGIQILSPALQPVGFGFYRATAPTPGMKIAAALTVPQLWNTPLNYPFMWPAEGKTISQTTYLVETPDARSKCGYTQDAGQPIFLLVGWHQVTGPVTGRLLLNGTPVPVCEIDETNYTNPDPSWQAIGRGILTGDGAVVLLPKDPLAHGTYTVEITVNNRLYTWSFGVLQTPFYRLELPSSGDHFYTTSLPERDNAVANGGYTDEGIACGVESQPSASVIPLYRSYAPRFGDHFYTTSKSEHDNAVANVGYTDEGVACYVYGAPMGPNR